MGGGSKKLRIPEIVKFQNFTHGSDLLCCCSGGKKTLFVNCFGIVEVFSEREFAMLGVPK